VPPITGIAGCCALAASGHAAEQRDELATFQLIEWHSAPASQGQIAGYRIDHSQSADILNLVNRWSAAPRHRQG
jgi:hypothetical protein